MRFGLGSSRGRGPRQLMAAGACFALCGSLLAVAGLPALPAGAAVNGHCGDAIVETLHAGQSLRVGSTTSVHLQVFPESQNVTLASPVAVDFSHVGTYVTPASLPATKPVLAAGTRVNSYLIHGGLPAGHAALRMTATIGFSTDIVGVQILSATLVETSVHQVRFPGVDYPGLLPGLELAGSGRGDGVRLLNSRTLEVSTVVVGNVDEVRVLTQGTTSTASALNGYRMLAADGGVFDFGGQQFYGSTGGTVLNQPIVSGVNTCGNNGYWFVARDGGVFSYGDAPFFGSLGATPPATPVSAMAATPTGAGYYLATAGYAVYPFGDAQGFGDLRTKRLNAPLVGMAATSTGHGYWLLGRDGGIFSFGDAQFYGSTGALRLVSPVIGFSPTRDGHGYWLFAADGGIFSFGDAQFHGSVGGAVRANPIVGMRVTASGNGYWLTDSAGKIYPFGDATNSGDMSTVHLFRPMIGMM
jgi:hypothetical protein